MSASRAFFRRRAIEQRRDPSQDARNEAAAADVQARVAQQLAQMPLIQRLNSEAQPAPANSGTG